MSTADAMARALWTLTGDRFDHAYVDAVDTWRALVPVRRGAYSKSTGRERRWRDELTGAEAWEAFANEGVITHDAVDDPHRRFEASTHPSSPDDAVTFAVRWPAVMAAEELMRDAVARLRPWGAETCEHVTWRVGEGGRSWNVLWIGTALALAWVKECDVDNMPSHVPNRSGTLHDYELVRAKWVVSVWSIVFGAAPCPLEPWLAFDAMGFSVESIGGGVIALACPPVNAEPLPW